MRGIEVLKKHKVEFNTLTCVHATTVKEPERIYRFLKSIGSKFIQFIPIVERLPTAKERARGQTHALPPDLSRVPDNMDTLEMAPDAVPQGAWPLSK